VDETLVNELEAAIADAGALLARSEKYTLARTEPALGLRRETLALGDAARRLHRHGALDDDAARRLLAEVAGVTARLRTLLADVTRAPVYVAARAALAAADAAGLAAALPAVFADLEPVARPPDLFHPLAWLRRGRLRPPADVAADVRVARDPGLEPEGDDLSPGVDPALPAVALSPAPPADEPVVLRLPAGTLAGPVHRLRHTGEHLVHGRRVRLPGVVRLARQLVLEEQLRVEVAPEDWDRWRAALGAALAADGVPVEDV
jgi:hypothetical protein